MFFKNQIIKKYRKRLKNFRINSNLKLNNLKTQFSRILNHDIKTALLAQTNCLKLLLKGKFGNLNDKQQEIVKDILSSNKFLEEIVNNAIILSRIKDETKNLKIENIDIVNQTKICVNNVQEFLDDKKQNIILNTDNNKINLTADKKAVTKIISNLIRSSIAYGFEKSDVVVSIKEDKNTISFLAKNKSIYMTKEKIKNIFESEKSNCDFNQLGMNLNLNIAKKLINAHNWDFIASSDKKNNTSTFGFVVKK